MSVLTALAGVWPPLSRSNRRHVPEQLQAQRESERARSRELAWGGLMPASTGFVPDKKWTTWNALLEAQLRTTLQRPWSEKEFPELATWLEINAEPKIVDALVAADQAGEGLDVGQ